MLDLRGLWRRHRRKVFISLGVVGGGYALYRLYGSHRRRIDELEEQVESERQANELIKSQLRAHFDTIQRISDTTTLPYAMRYLRSRIAEEVDLTHLTEKLMQGKGQSNALSAKEKLELWDSLKVLSFTRTTSSLWAMTMLCLYVRVQVNIVGRHIYLETAHDLSKAELLGEGDPFSMHGQQDFLATADYLSTYSISTLISNMQNVVDEVFKDYSPTPSSLSYAGSESFGLLTSHKKTIKRSVQHEPTTRGSLTGVGVIYEYWRANYWINYMLPENATAYRQLMAMSSNGFDDHSVLMDINKLEQLLMETRTALSSPDFRKLIDISIKKVLDILVEDIYKHFSVSSSSGVPLAKLIPRMAEAGLSLLEDPDSNKFVQVIQTMPEIEVFFTLLYTNMPTVS